MLYAKGSRIHISRIGRYKNNKQLTVPNKSERKFNFYIRAKNYFTNTITSKSCYQNLRKILYLKFFIYIVMDYFSFFINCQWFKKFSSKINAIGIERKE